MPDWYLFHDLLEQHNHPCYFAEFIEQLNNHRLRYVGDAEPQKNEPLEFPDDARKFLTSITDDRYGFEQYSDFFRMRMFRRAVVCRDSVELAMPDRRSIEAGGLYLASSMRPQPGLLPHEPVKYIAHNGGGLVVSHKWMQAVLQKLTDSWPHSVAIEELLALVPENADLKAQAAKTFLDSYFAGVVEITTEPHPAGDIGPKPKVFAPARLFARRGQLRVGNSRHEMVQLPAAVGALLPMIDGTKDLAALEADFSAFAPLLSSEESRNYDSLSQVLEFLRQNSLLA